MTKKKTEIRSLERATRKITNLTVVLVALLVFLAGIALFWLFGGRDWHAIPRDVGALLIVTVSITLIWELLLKRTFLDEIMTKTKKAIEEKLVKIDPSTIWERADNAMKELATNRKGVREMWFAGYVSKMLRENLLELSDKWHITHLKLLLRDIDEIDPTLIDEIPRDTKRISTRQSERKNALDDITHYKIKCKKVDVRYFRGQPVLRAVLIDGEIGFLNFYVKREAKNEPIDYSSRHLPVLRVSRRNRYEETLLENFKSWFNFVWKNGSYKKK